MQLTSFVAKTLLLAALTLSTFADEKLPSKLTVDSKLVNNLVNGTRQNVELHTEFDYTWQKSARVRSLIANRVALKMGGRAPANTEMSRQKFVQIADGRRTEFTFADAPARLQALLKDSFDVPIIELQVDDAGGEISRKITTEPGARDILDDGILFNSLLFHPRTPPAETEWQADREMSMGNGTFVSGKLTFKKISDRPGSVFAVSGILVNDRIQRPGTPIVMKDVRYVVTGEQTYDAAKKEWSSGNLKIEVSYALTADNKPLGTTTGTIQAAMELQK
jgi:hypothetical protein